MSKHKVIYSSPSFPDPPEEGSLFLDKDSGGIWVYTHDSRWELVEGRTGTAFVDYMPELEDLESMCKEFPALEKAYEKFKTVYHIVEKDWENKNERS